MISPASDSIPPPSTTPIRRSSSTDGSPDYLQDFHCQVKSLSTHSNYTFMDPSSMHDITLYALFSSFS